MLKHISIKRITTFALLSLFAVTGLSVAVPQSAYALTEKVTNVWETDGSNYTIYANVINGVFTTISPGYNVTDNISSFQLPQGICAMVRYNYGDPVLRGPGTHYISDGANVRVDPHRC